MYHVEDVSLSTKSCTDELKDCLCSWCLGLECYRQECKDDEMDSTANSVPVAARHTVLQNHG